MKSTWKRPPADRIAVDVYANAQLGGERQMLEGMTLGTIEMAMLSPGIAANIAPKFQVIDLPPFQGQSCRLQNARRKTWTDPQ
ncbi:MAG: hypothetical protein ACLUEQ_02340 [Cloacibacillus evryensis]